MTFLLPPGIKGLTGQCFMHINEILYIDDDHAETRPTAEIQFPYMNSITCTYMPTVPVHLYVQTSMYGIAC